MKRVLLFFAVFCGVVSAYAQGPASIKLEDVTEHEVVSSFKLLGIIPLRFDLSGILKGSGYNVRFYVDEYKDGELAVENKYYLGLGSLCAPIPADPAECAVLGGVMRKPVSDADTVYYWDRLAIVVKLPTGGDNKASAELNVCDRKLDFVFPLDFGKKAKKKGRNRAFYSVSPFVDLAFSADSHKIPLVAVGESWYDKEYDTFRYCTGAFTSDMSNSAFKYSPHIYVLGLEFVDDHSISEGSLSYK